MRGVSSQSPEGKVAVVNLQDRNLLHDSNARKGIQSLILLQFMESGYFLEFVHFKKGSIYDRHKHLIDEWLYVIDGKLYDREYGITYLPNFFVHSRPDSIQHIEALEDSTFLLIWKGEKESEVKLQM